MAEATAVTRLDREKQNLKMFKEKVSRIYEDMGNFMITTADQMDDFRKMITPYVDYFYPLNSGSSGDCFVTDVVIPSGRELGNAIERAVNITAGDAEMNGKVSRAIESVMGLKKSIDNILWLIDEIDIYSENTLVISTKYGEEGMSLARISKEMVMMARLVNGIGMQFSDYLDMLDGHKDEFTAIQERLESLSHNHFALMKEHLSTAFGTMASELESVSKHVNGMLSNSIEAELSMKNFIKNIQMEDIIRQKAEKIMFYLDQLDGDAGSEDCSAIANLDAVVLHVASDRLSDLEKDVSRQYGEVSGFCNRITLLLDEILSKFYGDGIADVEKERNRLDMIYTRIENLKDEYVRCMEEIISGKRMLLNLFGKIIDILSLFDGLFSEIVDILKRFEALNMITRIELARHIKLSRALGGALTSVKILPAKMKKILKESQDLYHGIQKNIKDAVAMYTDNFRLQEKVLDECIASMKTVSVKLYESQKYYGDISKEIGRYCWKMLEFIDGNGSIGVLSAVMESIREAAAGINGRLDSEYGVSKPDMESVKRLVLETAETAQCGSLLDALRHEFESKKTAERVILF